MPGRPGLAQEQRTDLSCASGGFAVAFAGGHDRALHEDVPGAGEALGVGDPRLVGQPLEEGPDPCQVHDGGCAHRAGRVGCLEEDVDERAALEVLSVEPLVEDVEDREEPVARVGSPPLDLFEERLAVSRQNVLAHLDDDTGIALDFRAGDLLTCVPPDRRFCLVYENLPNVRAATGMDVRLGTVAGRFFDATRLVAPERFETYQLALHHECLRQARGRIRDGGAVLTALGGRMPLELAYDLHRSCGYVPELVVFDAKVQAEPELVLPSYARIEKEKGVEFSYYAIGAVELVAGARRSGLEGAALEEATREPLLGYRMSASEALARSRRGEPVVHSALMIAGTWIGPTPGS